MKLKKISKYYKRKFNNDIYNYINNYHYLHMEYLPCIKKEILWYFNFMDNYC